MNEWLQEKKNEESNQPRVRRPSSPTNISPDQYGAGASKKVASNNLII